MALHRKADPAQLKAFINLHLGLPWEDRSSAVKPHHPARRAEDVELGRIPPGVLALTGGIDTLDTWLDVTLLGWSPWQDDGRPGWRVIDWHQIHGDTSRQTEIIAATARAAERRIRFPAGLSDDYWPGLLSEVYNPETRRYEQRRGAEYKRNEPLDGMVYAIAIGYHRDVLIGLRRARIYRENGVSQIMTIPDPAWWRIVGEGYGKR